VLGVEELRVRLGEVGAGAGAGMGWGWGELWVVVKRDMGHRWESYGYV
jgi:hypothetical protein